MKFYSLAFVLIAQGSAFAPIPSTRAVGVATTDTVDLPIFLTIFKQATRLQVIDPAAVAASVDIPDFASAVAPAITNTVESTGLDTPVLGAIGAAVTAVAGGIAAMTGKGGATATKVVKEVEPEPEPEPIDVSIPYDATFQMAYNTYRGDAAYDDAEYEAFKTIYEKMVVAQVTAKRYTRDFKGYEKELMALKK